MKRLLFMCFIYTLFFFSGAAALMYQVVWVRSLSLIFGGSHLAVTAVLSIFMTGLAIGGYIIGKYVDSFKKPLQLYGVLEIGIAFFALVFAGLTEIYPTLYIALAQGKDDAVFYLTFIRVLFSVIALIVPTTLMGGTLPVLSRFLSRRPDTIRSHLSFLYGFNTLGAVLGAGAAGFFFLRFYSVSFTLKTAVFMNLAIGVVSILLQNKSAEFLDTASEDTDAGQVIEEALSYKNVSQAHENADYLPLKLVIWGIGISGFCALGYEVLWTRVLSLVLGASVYSFTTMLVAFLTGIALGSNVFGLLPGFKKGGHEAVGRSIFWFGIVQIIIGITALLVTVQIRDLPANAVLLRNFFQQHQADVFGVRLWVNFILAFGYMVVPAFFMGVAFPLAGKVHAEFKKRIGLAVGEVLAFNTVGAILGAAISGFVLLYLFGIERALQILIIINIGYGFLVLASLAPKKLLYYAVAAASAVMILFFMFNNTHLRLWNTNYFAIYRNNDPAAFRTPEMIQEALDNTEILYYQEGVEAVISSIRGKGGGIQALLVNSKVVADTHPSGIQCQFTLGHLPMLLHKNPRKVLVVGLGTGMTLGATSVHPSVEKMTLVEIEPRVIGGAKTFAAYNHNVLDNPKLNIVFNDGRNFLLTTDEKFDVITADPIHPWAQGASYLYTVEYFKLAADHLLPGGIMCQWLPVYELSTRDLQSVVKTFSRNFKYTMLWLTHHDAELIGSNSPIVIDEAALQQRIASTDAIRTDLQQVHMGSATDFLSYFVMGTDMLNKYSETGVLNTDNNLFLEFSSPVSIARPVMTENLNVMVRYMENIYKYLELPEEESARAELRQKWDLHYNAARVAVRAQALFVGQLHRTPDFQFLAGVIKNKYSFFAPGQFVLAEYKKELARDPRLLKSARFMFLNQQGVVTELEIAAVISPVSDTRAYVVFVNNAKRIIYGKTLFTGSNINERTTQFAHDVFENIRITYDEQIALAQKNDARFPALESTMALIKQVIAGKIEEAASAVAGQNV